MEDESDRERENNDQPTNDNCGPEHANVEDTDIAPWQRVDRVVLSIARLIGRQIAREHFEALQAANDNRRPAEEAEGHGPKGREEG
ncbi:hypothetical protein NTH_00886 [Nitratireductor thuwali]|uniref:Uncharacterized protein n=1 Tax=Nitratireductor thuwali TaxID=2267699 RepID=A0ABY5MHS9_9HYPH|nr:hypothetical protein NTH_00886 [Nitratireductor thuwali]